jgi:membrane dipeptidase
MAALLTWPLTLAAQESEVDYATSAQMIAQKSMLIDTHIDVPYRLEERWADVTQRTEDGDFDYERARRGGLNIPFMSIYTPAGTSTDGSAFKLANRLIDSVEALAGRQPKRIAMVHNSQQARKARKLGLMGLALGMENGAPIEGKLENVQFFRDRGVAYITLAHSKSNHLSDSSFDKERPWGGLSPFGKKVLAEMNRLGIMADVSHLSDQAFWQVIELSKTPVIASHSSPRHFTPGYERNMSDEMIQAMARNGGVIMINFGSGFLTDEARLYFEAFKAARSEFLEANGVEEHNPLALEWLKAYRAEHPYPYATLDDAVAAFRHVVDLVGVEHVGIGSDFDGVGDSLPEGLKDVSYYPALIEEFLKLDYSLEDIQAILGGNLMRVWSAVDEYAREAAAAAAG